MSRTTRDDIEKMMEIGLFVPTKTIELSGEVDIDLARRAIRALTALDATRTHEPIRILLNCPGGEVVHGLAIYNAIRRCKSEVHITVVGEAESMGAWILQAADVRRAYVDASIMIHVGEHGLPSSHPMNHVARLRQYEVQSERLEQILADRLDVPVLEVHDLIQFDQIYSAHEAKAVGLIDEVVE